LRQNLNEKSSYYTFLKGRGFTTDDFLPNVSDELIDKMGPPTADAVIEYIFKRISLDHLRSYKPLKQKLLVHVPKEHPLYQDCFRIINSNSDLLKKVKNIIEKRDFQEPVISELSEEVRIFNLAFTEPFSYPGVGKILDDLETIDFLAEIGKCFDETVITADLPEEILKHLAEKEPKNEDTLERYQLIIGYTEQIYYTRESSPK
jgi:hypothetical protein